MGEMVPQNRNSDLLRSESGVRKNFFRYMSAEQWSYYVMYTYISWIFYVILPFMINKLYFSNDRIN